MKTTEAETIPCPKCSQPVPSGKAPLQCQGRTGCGHIWYLPAAAKAGKPQPAAPKAKAGKSGPPAKPVKAAKAPEAPAGLNLAGGTGGNEAGK